MLCPSCEFRTFPHTAAKTHEWAFSEINSQDKRLLCQRFYINQVLSRWLIIIMRTNHQKDWPWGKQNEGLTEGSRVASLTLTKVLSGYIQCHIAKKTKTLGPWSPMVNRAVNFCVTIFECFFGLIDYLEERRKMIAKRRNITLTPLPMKSMYRPIFTISELTCRKSRRQSDRRMLQNIAWKSVLTHCSIKTHGVIGNFILVQRMHFPNSFRVTLPEGLSCEF